MKNFEGKELKVVYRDGECVKTFHGQIKDAELFIELQMADGRKMLINKSMVLKMVEK